MFGKQHRRRGKLCQTYTRTLKQLMIDQRFHNHPKRKKKAKAAARKIKGISGRVFRDINRKLDEQAKKKYNGLFDTFSKILEQKQTSKNKVYSIH